MLEKTIYRIENDNGEGPYLYPDGGWRPAVFWVRGQEHSPFTDVPEWSLYSEKCRQLKFGFQSIKTMTSWFCKETRQNLAPSKYHVAIYEIPTKDVMTGGNQVVIPKSSIPVIRLPITNRFEDLLAKGFK